MIIGKLRQYWAQSNETLRVMYEVQPDRFFFLVGYLILLPIYIAPLLVTRFMPGLDLGFHLAIVDVLSKMNEPLSDYRQMYDARLHLDPYAVHFVLLRLLGFFMSLNWAHKVIIAAYIAIMPLSISRLLASCNRSRLPALFGLPLSYSLNLHYGFINFAISIPLVFFLLAEVALILQKDKPRISSYLRLILLTVGVFLSHMLNIVFGVGVAVIMLLITRASLKRRALVFSCFIPSLAAILFFQRTVQGAGEPGSQNTSFMKVIKILWEARLDDTQRTWPGFRLDIWHRVSDIHVHLLRGFTDDIDQWASIWFQLVIVAFILVGVGLLLYRRRRGQTEKQGTQSWWLGSIITWLIILAYFVLPFHIVALETMTVHPRFSPMVVALLPLLAPMTLRRLSPKWTVIMLVPFLSLSLWFGRVLIEKMGSFDHELANFSQTIDRLPAGKKVVGLMFDRGSRVMRNEAVLISLPAYYAIERRDPRSFVPIHYCGLRHYPCRIRDPKLLPPSPSVWGPQEFDPIRAVPYFDYFIVNGGPPPEKIFGATWPQIEQFSSLGSVRAYRKKSAK